MEPFLSIRSNDVYFEQDWETGIGGGLWSTGMAMARYLNTDHACREFHQLRDRLGRNISVLELGSGNGLLAVCWLALGGALIDRLVVTDDATHLELIRDTFRANTHLTSQSHTKVYILEHLWGQFKECSGGSDMETNVQSGHIEFDLIVGSDVAYRAELYDPLIASLEQFSNSNTVSIIGVTMNDTRPAFFKKLREAGFTYRRLADNLCTPEFRGTTFGVFIIQKYST